MRRFDSWSTWAVLGLVLAESAGAVFLATRGAGPGSAATATATLVFVLATATVGTLIGLRRPGHRIGWLLRLAAFSFASGALIVTYLEVAFFVHPGSLPVGPPLVILGDWVFGLGFGISATYLLLLFPTGRLPSPRWRPVSWLAAISLIMMMLGVLLGTSAFEDLPIANPLAMESSHPLLLLFEGGGFYLLFMTMLASVASLVVRYRSSVGEERQQLKWVASGVVILGVGVAASVLWELINGVAELSDDTENLVIAVSLTMIPISIGVAILRFRLYDIDRIISRTVSYGVVVALIAAVFFGSVTLLGSLLPDDSPLSVAASTLSVAALFNPLRRKVQRFVDKLFNRSRYDAGRTIDAFSARLRSEVDLDQLARDLQGVAAETMQPASLALWLRG
ncbi:MAG TPA: hypothetical protein VMS99_09150 [Acidimicrobiia bacterium]|nr:hypothetical protein [Acidimicrobiia bacterium]